MLGRGCGVRGPRCRVRLIAGFWGPSWMPRWSERGQSRKTRADMTKERSNGVVAQGYLKPPGRPVLRGPLPWLREKRRGRLRVARGEPCGPCGSMGTLREGCLPRMGDQPAKLQPDEAEWPQDLTR